MTGKDVLEELAAIGFARVNDYLRIDGKALVVRDLDALPPGAAAAVASVETSSTGLKVKFYDKLRALELLGKCMGLFDAGAARSPEDTNLLQAILDSTAGEVCVDDLQELQQAAEPGAELVEPSGV